jgi:hypothetical protein
MHLLSRMKMMPLAELVEANGLNQSIAHFDKLSARK